MFGTLGDFYEYKPFPQYSKHEHDTLLHLEPQGDKTVDISISSIPPGLKVQCSHLEMC